MIAYPNLDAVKTNDWVDLAKILVEDPIDNIYCVADNGICAYIKMLGANYLRDSDFILIGFSGAVNNKGLDSGPFFSFSGISQQLQLPLISFSDPSLMLNPNLTLGWYLGNSYIPDYPVKIAGLLDSISTALNKKVILCGGSGGGFAALNISNMMSNKTNALAFVWNPQVVINKYYKTAVDKYIDICWNANQDLVRSTNVISKGAKSLFLMDGLDSNHLRLHLREYLKNSNLKSFDNNYFFYQDSAVVIGDWGTGHTAPPKNIIIHHIKEIILKWDSFDAYEKLSFVKNVVDFTDLKAFQDFKRKVKPKISLVSRTFLIELEINNSYIGYQLRYKVLDGTNKTIMISPYLRNYNNCRVFGVVPNNIELKETADWTIVVIIEDYFGNEKNIKSSFIKKQKIYNYMRNL